MNDIDDDMNDIDINELDLNCHNEYDNIGERLGSLNGATFMQEVKVWQNFLISLPELRANEIREEMYEWNLSIPSKNNFDFNDLVSTYYDLTNYKNRLSYFISDTMSVYETAIEAHKSLKDIAMKLFNGKQSDQKAEATFVTQPFLMTALRAKTLLNFLTEYKSAIDFAANNLNRLMIERQSQAKMNYRAASEGASIYAAKDEEDNITKRDVQPYTRRR